MIIDDDPGTIDVLSLILTNAGHRVTANPAAELSFLESGLFPDVLLLDIQVGSVSGSAICSYLKQQEHTAHIPVILLSGADNLEEIALACRANDFISKPFCIKELMDKIEQHASVKSIT